MCKCTGKCKSHQRARRTREARVAYYADRAAELESVMAGAITEGQQDILNDELRALTDGTQLSPRTFSTTSAFFLAAAQVPGKVHIRRKVEEIIDLIMAGESFADYRPGDGLWRWQKRRRVRAHSSLRSLAAELVRRLTHPTTPPDYRAALTDAIKAYARASDTSYDPADIAGTLLDAAANNACEYNHDGPVHTAWLRMCDLLHGLRKKRPLSHVIPRRVAADKSAGQGNEQTDSTAKLAELRARLEQLKKHGDITDSTERFRLEREIYDLEHAPADDDEWPEFIGEAA
jgi:hypothetical protein